MIETVNKILPLMQTDPRVATIGCITIAAIVIAHDVMEHGYSLELTADRITLGA